MDDSKINMSPAENASQGKEFTRFCEETALPNDSKRAKNINGTMVLVVHTQGKLFAVSNVCSHQDKFLHVGRVRNCKITCPLHGAQFDLATGKATCLPATKPIPTFEVRVVDGWVEVRV